MFSGKKSMKLPRTLGELKKRGYKSRSIKEELRENLIVKAQQEAALFPGIVGYDGTVVPGLVNAILSKHDLILLGLRGQAKSLILRSLVWFLDDYIPVLPGTEINDNPLCPITRRGKDMIQEHGDGCEIEWLAAEERYHEKLATPDITIADLIGDIDPIKAAIKKLDFSDEEVIHYGIIPRTNRGIFAINELPDLPARIQVGLLNIMEEKDIQIRGFPVRLPLDIVMVYSANPEDYTSRGSIITPLKDRIDSQILTHYPETIADAMKITEQEAWTERKGRCRLLVPDYFRELIEEVAFAARNSEFVDQQSGVSARMSISLLENVLSNMERRGLRHGERSVCPRISDLHTAITAITGKVELVYEGEREGAPLVARKLIGEAVKKTFRDHFPDPETEKKDQKAGKEERERTSAKSPYSQITRWFSRGRTVETSDDISSAEYHKALSQVDGLKDMASKHLPAGSDDGGLSLAMELILEGLHQHSMLSKKELGRKTSYRDMLKAMLDQMAASE